MFSCLDDASDMLDHRRQNPKDDEVDYYKAQVKELRKNIKQLSTKIFQLESDRCSERVQFQKDYDSLVNAKDDSKRLEHLTQAHCNQEQYLLNLEENYKKLNEVMDDKDSQIALLTDRLASTEGKFSDKLHFERREFERVIESLHRQRDLHIDSQSSIFLRRAMVAEAELEQIRIAGNTRNEDLKNTHEETCETLDKLNAENATLKEELATTKDLLLDKEKDMKRLRNELTLSSSSLQEILDMKST